MPAVEKVNQRLREEAGGGRLSVDFPGRVSYVDCGGPFRAGGGRRESGEEEAEEVVVRLMPDRLHPNPEGRPVSNPDPCGAGTERHEARVAPRRPPAAGALPRDGPPRQRLGRAADRLLAARFTSRRLCAVTRKRTLQEHPSTPRWTSCLMTHIMHRGKWVTLPVGHSRDRGMCRENPIDGWPS